jgi:hypothetical protein
MIFPTSFVLRSLLGLAVRTVAAAEPAILAQLQPFRGFLFVLLRVVVATLALGASHHDHHAILFFCHSSVPRDKK